VSDQVSEVIMVSQHANPLKAKKDEPSNIGKLQEGPVKAKLGDAHDVPGKSPACIM